MTGSFCIGHLKGCLPQGSFYSDTVSDQCPTINATERVHGACLIRVEYTQ